jgi:hypothetical protein
VELPPQDLFADLSVAFLANGQCVPAGRWL